MENLESVVLGGAAFVAADTGSPMKEVIDYFTPKIKDSTIVETLGLKNREYFVVSCHREENVDDLKQLTSFVNIVNYLAESYSLPIIVSTHPRTKKRLDENKLKVAPLVKLNNPLCFTDYIKLQMNSKVTLSDSGTITEESSILNFPAVNIREAHERPEGMDEAAVMFTGMNLERVQQAIAILESQPLDARITQIVSDYDVENVSEKVVRIVVSYTDYVNRSIWQKKDL